MLDMERSEITIYRGWNCQICEYLEKVKLMYRHNSKLFFLPFQGAFDQLDSGSQIDNMGEVHWDAGILPQLNNRKIQRGKLCFASLRMTVWGKNDIPTCHSEGQLLKL